MPLADKVVIEVHAEIDGIPADEWNALVENQHPFMNHAFLSALEKFQCVSPKFGWIPHHISIRLNKRLIGALPLYEKHNNYGEFVFDQAWANAWQHAGIDYYPKLVSATPYTPALGQRCLAVEDCEEANQEEIFTLLIQAMQSFCIQTNMSGGHILFSAQEQQSWLKTLPNFLHRQDCQYHWQNQNYQSFDDFLSQLKPKKRKNIKQERKAILQSGITFRQLNGHSASAEDWKNFDLFYQNTFLEKWGTPTLNLDFFKAIAQAIPNQVLLVLADLEGECIAGALMFRSKTHLYGRHWGCSKQIKHLHFETCFYQGIDYAIQNGLEVFEPGAGGEHKIARGFSPVSLFSSHWLAQNPFPEGINQFIAEESKYVTEAIEENLTNGPYKSNF